MKVLRLSALLSVIAAVTVVAQQDYSNVCFPQIFTLRYFNLITEDTGYIYVNFTSELWAEVSNITGNRVVHNFISLTSHEISGQGNNTSCRSFKLRPSQIMRRCLPPYATLVEAATGLQYSTNYVYTFEVPTEYDTVFRITFQYVSASLYWPLISQQYGYHGTTDVFLYTALDPAVKNTTVFSIPASCITKDVHLPVVLG